MPSFADSAVIFILALILFGPKKLPQLARQLGKLMAEFRRASNEFRMQMEDELRIEEQKEHQAKVEAMAGPSTTTPPEPDQAALPASEHAASPEGAEPVLTEGISSDEPATTAEPAPIAESGSLRMMPPSTGLPVASGVHARHRGTDMAPHDTHASNGNNESRDDTDVPEHSILPPAVGMSSEEPMEETRMTEVHGA